MPPKQKLRPEDFEFMGVLGEGAYARVMLAEMKSTKVRYAIKVVNKRFITRNKKVETVMNEKKVLSRMDHRHVVKLFYTFQDDESLYYVLGLAENGELYTDLKRVGKYPLHVGTFYAAELVVVLEYLHSNGIIHRDLKPENILLDKNRHLKITDFGTSKIISTDDDTANRKKSFVGTAEYVSPEVLRDCEAGKPADMWALGCIIYQMLTGNVPFKGESEYLTFRKIEELDYEPFPENFDIHAKDLILKLLVKNPNERLGSSAEGYIELKSHLFFKDIDWNNFHEAIPPKLDIDEGNDRKEDDNIITTTAEDSDSDWQELDDGEERRVTKMATENLPPPIVQEKKTTQWDRFLMTNEKILYSGYVVKHRGLFSKERQLILTNYPRFIYIDVAKMIMKGEIPFTSKLRVEEKSPRQFCINTDSRRYYILGLTSGAAAWVKEINAVKWKYGKSGEHFFE